MLQYADRRYRCPFTFVFPMICCVLFLASCGSPQSGGTAFSATSPQNTIHSWQQPYPMNLPSLSMIHGSMRLNLEHTPTGKALFTWKPANQTLQVTLSLTGLAPNSTHPAHIHLGSCEQSSMGQVVSPLMDVKADAQGNATVTTMINGVKKGIPAPAPKGWFVNVHNGPTLSTELERRWLACGNVSSVQTGPDGVQSAQVNLGATTSADEHVQGTAALSLQGDQVKVVLQLSGLIPRGTPHMAHIHRGSCAAQGAVVDPLNPVIVDWQGNGTSTTFILLPSIPTGPFYINVHEGPMPKTNQPIPQQDFNPIACGNIPLLP